MMRAIKFKGLRTDGKGFVYGDLEQRKSETLIRVFDKTLPYNSKLVDPETVGQFTGLQDKNGTDIYEGDIYRTGESPLMYQIFFINGCFCGGVSIEKCSPIGFDYDEESTEPFISTFYESMEVIGNIHQDEDK